MKFAAIKRDLNSNFYFSDLSDDRRGIRISTQKSLKPKEFGITKVHKKRKENGILHLDYGVFCSFAPTVDSGLKTYGTSDSICIKRQKVLIGEYEPLLLEKTTIYDGKATETLLEIDEIEDVEAPKDVNLLEINDFLISQLQHKRDQEYFKMLENNLQELVGKSARLYDDVQLKEAQKRVPSYDKVYKGTL